jgi:TetR/AcrR family transcriptional regulator
MPKDKAKPGSMRDTILDISMRLFADFGYEGVSIRQIAQEAGITLPSIYYHFGNKEELFKTVESIMYGGHAETLIDDLLLDATPEERLRKFMHNLMDSFESNPIYFKLVQRNLIDMKEGNQKFLVETSLQGLFDELKKLLNEHQSGCGNGVAPVMVFSSIVGFETMRPAIQLLKGYKYSSRNRKQERRLVIDSIIKAIDGS